MDLGDFFREEEEKRLAKARAEIAAEKAEWDALSPEDQKARIEAVEAKYGAFEGKGIEEEFVCPNCAGDLDEDGCRFCDSDEEFPE